MGEFGVEPGTFGVTILVAAFLIALAESGLGLGSVLPGEVILVAAATAVARWDEAVLLTLAATLGAWSGDHIGYFLGRTSGTKLRRSRAVASLGVERWDKAAELLRRLGVIGVAIGRLTPLVRTLVPIAAGASDLRWKAFAIGSFAGAAIWAGVWVGLGATVGTMTPTSAALIGVPTAIALIVWMLVRSWRDRRRRN